MVKLLLSFLAVVTLIFPTFAQAFELKDITRLFNRNQTELQSQDFLEQTKIGQKEFHEPKVSGEKIEAKPYLIIPFAKSDVEKGIKISEGWFYSFDEFQIHGMKVHAGVDFSTPYGTTIYSPAEGYAMSSYHNLSAEGDNQEIITKQGKEVSFGLGLFIRLYIPAMNRFIDLAHLSEINSLIPFSEPEYDEIEKVWHPTNEKVLISEIPTNPNWVKVVRGEVLGKVGTSGLEWGYEDFQGIPQRKIELNPKVNPSWDEPHLHLEEFSFIQTPATGEKAGQKVAPRDIFGIYSFSKDYPSLTQKLDQKFKPLILTDQDGVAIFAKGENSKE